MKKPQTEVWGFFIYNLEISNLPGSLSQVQHCTWLGEAGAASSGRNEAHAELPGSG